MEALYQAQLLGDTRELLESELFGHEKARLQALFRKKKGSRACQRRQRAADEIGVWIFPAKQDPTCAEEREFERVGGTQMMPLTRG
jgi:transcriptional regulator with GAF, ATPase, and Fis domain